MPQPGGGWSEVRATLQGANLIQEGVSQLSPAKHETIGVHNVFTLTVRVYLRNPRVFVPLDFPV